LNYTINAVRWRIPALIYLTSIAAVISFRLISYWTTNFAYSSKSLGIVCTTLIVESFNSR